MTSSAQDQRVETKGEENVTANEATAAKRIRLGDFSRWPGPRYRTQGEASGEELREQFGDWLGPDLTKAIAGGTTLTVYLGGTEYGPPIGFLEEAFGGLVRKFGIEAVMRHLVLEDDKHGSAAEVGRVMGYAANHPPEKNPLNGDDDRVALGKVRRYALSERVRGDKTKRGAKGKALYDALEKAAARFPSWNWPLMSEWDLVRGEALKDHAAVTAAARGCDPDSWPGRHVDWDAAAEDLSNELASITWKGRTWWVAPMDGAHAKPTTPAQAGVKQRPVATE